VDCSIGALQTFDWEQKSLARAQNTWEARLQCLHRDLAGFGKGVGKAAASVVARDGVGRM